MRKGKKSALTVLGVGAIAMALVGCGSGGSSGSSGSSGKTGSTSSNSANTNNAVTTTAAATTSSGGQHHTIQFWTISLHPTFDNYINTEIKDYENAHPNVTVKWTDLPYKSIETKLLAAIASGNPPDVVNLNTEMALEMAGKGALVDLNKAATPAQKDIYFQKMWDSTKLGNGVYAFPWYLTPDVLMYNKSIFQKAGLDPNNPPKTWDEVVKDSKIIKAKTGIYGFMWTGNPLDDFVENGIPLLNASKTKATFDTPAGVKMMEWYKSLITDNVVPHDNITKGYSQAVNDYQAGTLAMLITGPQFLTRVKTGAPNVYNNTLTAPLPTWSTGIIPAPLMDLAVPTGSKDKKDAIDFANYMTNDKSQLAFDKLVDILPSTKKAAQNPYFTQAGNTPEDKAKLITVQELPHAEDITLGLKTQNQLNSVLTKAAQAVMSGQKSPQQALDDAQKQWDVILSGN